MAELKFIELEKLAEIKANINKLYDLKKDLTIVQKDIQLLEVINKALLMNLYIENSLSKNDSIDLNTGQINYAQTEVQNGTE